MKSGLLAKPHMSFPTRQCVVLTVLLNTQSTSEKNSLHTVHSLRRARLSVDPLFILANPHEMLG